MVRRDVAARALWSAWVGFAAALACCRGGHAATAVEEDPCTRPGIGSEVPEPPDLRSHDGVLKVRLTLRNHRESDGSTRYCYLFGEGAQSPTLRLKAGDTLVLTLENRLTDLTAAHAAPQSQSRSSATHAHGRPSGTECAGARMSPISTNLHFHGLALPPVCHQDDVLKTSIEPGDAPFEYRFRIPVDQPPGLYWYHPHIHGFSTGQVLGGASGALIIEGIERAEPQTAALPERVLVIRDQELSNPAAPSSSSEPPGMLIDRDGDAANTGTGSGKPARDLSLNYVPVPYPQYPPATLTMRAGERQLWRVLNASTVTYLNLAVIVRRTPQRLGIVALDGVPLSAGGSFSNAVEWRDHIGLPPGGRVEFMVDAPPSGVRGLLVTRSVDTGRGGENDPNRALASMIADDAAPEPRSRLPASPGPLASGARPWLGVVAPVRLRKLYFSESTANPADPHSATEFYLTVDGQAPKSYDPAAGEPDIVVRQGDVEDWIIENRSMELHAFHIHQLHFLLLDWSGVPVNEPFLRDTVNVPYYSPTMLRYPSVRLRMDFRDPNIVGTFVYHCHILEHEDAGMMGTVRVAPRD
jgi:FtsP/CotA-like multicopper oxidase with cupredoxin domain